MFLVKLMNHTGLCDDKLALYSPTFTHRTYPTCFDHGRGTNGFRPPRPRLIVEILS